MILRHSGKVLNWISNAIREVIFHLLYSSLRWWRTSLGTWNPTSWWTCACWSVRWPSDSHCLHLFGTSCDPSLNLVLFSSCVSYRILFTQTNTLSRNIRKNLFISVIQKEVHVIKIKKMSFLSPPPPKKKINIIQSPFVVMTWFSRMKTYLTPDWLPHFLYICYAWIPVMRRSRSVFLGGGGSVGRPPL